ncbi:MAG TPA: CHAT domain-containing protein, partial [Terriglobales bacterium]
GNRLDELYPLLVKGQVAAALHDGAKAEGIFREVADDPQSDSSLKWEAQHSLARLEEDLGQPVPARREYEAALCTFETARSSVHHEESKLPFFTNAARIYDDYISFLIKSGQSRRALEVADYSRGRTLAEGLGLLRNERCAAPPLNPERVAAGSNATILYYWLGQQQSYLWVITKTGVRNVALPPSAQIDASVRRYREALVNGEDVLANSNTDGLQLYQQLVAPAIPMLQLEQHGRTRVTSALSRTASGPQRLKPVSLASSGGTARSRALPDHAENSFNLGAGAAASGGAAESRALPNPAGGSSNLHLATSAPRVIVVPDGSLNSLNFETMLVPGNPAPHYWIEDATITNVQSLRLLTAEKSVSGTHALSGAEGNLRRTAKLLLVGDAVPHPPEYPALPNAELEIQNIDKHFAASAVTQYTQSSATAAAFLDSKPEQYSYIHFVAHAVASSQVPLDSAVILSPTGKDDSFKLYARDIIQHHLRARLVTVSACYGAGTRSYNGEGLIGLSWAFLRAGARNTIGALWEVNDASTPQLMDHFYAELQQGRRPDVALRDAKLALMHSSNTLSKPFYWAPFQLYGTS